MSFKKEIVFRMKDSKIFTDLIPVYVLTDEDLRNFAISFYGSGQIQAGDQTRRTGLQSFDECFEGYLARYSWRSEK